MGEGSIEPERARRARWAIDEERRRFKEDMKTIFNNKRCPICGLRFMTGVVCRRVGASICMRHCKDCKHFSADFWHCLYLGTAHR